ncbi:Tyrosinase [Dactylella cylindrospora]|nr:Tyrosinase [Dactylella cylindrospora]
MAKTSLLLQYFVTLLSLFAMFESVNAQLSWEDIIASWISRWNEQNGIRTTTTSRRTTTTSRVTTTSIRPTTTSTSVRTTTSVRPPTSSSTTLQPTTTSSRPPTTTSSRPPTTSSRPPTTTSRSVTTLSTTTRSTTISTTMSSRTTSSSPTPSYDAVVGAGSCANRLKIETMQSSQPDAFNLLILALARLQATADSQDLSYFQLSGIHGAPFIPWQMDPDVGQYDRTVGYCTHHSVIFTTWHRPYLLLLEQTIYRAGASIANSFTGDARTRYINALAQLRLPYWDWADPNTQSHLPTVCMSTNIQVTQPDANGNPVGATIPNPLNAYTFRTSSISSFASPFNTWRRTARQPDSNGNSRDSVADSAMQSGFSTRRRSTYNSFSRTGFNAFSNAVENVHDDVHVRVGGNGHMSYVPYSAFDPIFWLHHVNVDRLTAMYQAANPGFLLASGAAVGTFARPSPPATQDTINTPLYPFRRSDLSWWTSVHTSYANSTWLNGYGYPEVPCSYQTQSSAALDSFTTTQINTLYGGSAPAQKIKRDDGGKYVEWDANIVIDQSELVGSFVIYIYLGKPEQDYNLWPLSGKEIGSLASMGFPQRKKKSMIRSAIVPISPVLEERGIEGSVEEISAYLEKELTWVVLNNGQPVDVKTLKSLKVAISVTEITSPQKSNKLPVWGKPNYHLNISHDKHGGAKSVGDIEDPTLLDGRKGKPATGNTYRD